MKSRIVALVLFFAVGYSASAQLILKPTEQEKLIEERFEYIKLIKSFVGKIYWKDFSVNSFPGTIVYFNDSASYFINPLSEMKDKVSKYSVLENEYDWSIWKLRMPFDSTPYVMETQFQFNPKAKVYINYRRPVLFCSSPELMKREKENITNTQQWSIALMHELYHQYQYSNEAILTYVLRLYDEKKWMDMDSLQVLYLKDKSFKDSVKLENDLLERAVAATSMQEEIKLYTQFLKVRANRQRDFVKKYKDNISNIESFWEKLEGTCLKMERILKEDFTQITPPPYIVEHDGMYAQNFSFNEKDKSEIHFYNELDDKRFYIGTTGYNLVQLLEKNNVPYKENLYKYASLPLDLQLKYFYKIK